MDEITYEENPWEGYEEFVAELNAHESQCHEVACMACKIQAAATEHVLRQQGWHLSQAGEFCPSHSDYPAHQQLVLRSRVQVMRRAA